MTDTSVTALHNVNVGRVFVRKVQGFALAMNVNVDGWEIPAVRVNTKILHMFKIPVH